MKKTITYFLSIIFVTIAPTISASSIEFNNKILTHVGPKTITVLDVKKEMDRQIYIYDKKKFSDVEAIAQFYRTNWKSVLNKLVQDELTFLEAERMKFTLPEHQIQEKSKELFGNDQIESLNFLSITPETAKDFSNKQLIASNMIGYMVLKPTFQQVTPSTLSLAYNDHIKALEKKDKWTYKLLYVQGKDNNIVEEKALLISSLIEDKKHVNLSNILKNIGTNNEAIKFTLSDQITLKTEELSPKILQILQNLEEGTTSKVINEKRKNKNISKIIQLVQLEKMPLPSFENVSQQLQSQAIQLGYEERSKTYFAKLYKDYDVQGLYGDNINRCFTEPFVIKDD